MWYIVWLRVFMSIYVVDRFKSSLLSSFPSLLNHSLFNWIMKFLSSYVWWYWIHFFRFSVLFRRTKLLFPLLHEFFFIRVGYLYTSSHLYNLFFNLKYTWEIDSLRFYKIVTSGSGNNANNFFYFLKTLQVSHHFLIFQFH